MRALGEQLRFAAGVMARRRNPLDMGPEDARDPKEFVRLIMQVVVSLAVLATGIYLLLQGGSDKQQEVGAGLIGTVLGYWLR